MAKQIFFDDAGRRQLLAGVTKLAKAVAVTLGPSGRCVMLEKKHGVATFTKDGVTVSKEVEVENPFENMGAKLVNEVATRTNKDVGDGTTTSVVLAEAMLTEGNRFVTAGASPIAIRNGMLAAADCVVKSLAKNSVPVRGRKDLEHVAYIASNCDQALSTLVADALTKVGAKGVVTVEENEGINTVVDMVDGMEFDKGYVSPYFITNVQEGQVRLENPYLLITDHKVSSIRDIVPLLEKVLVTRKPLLIVADEVEGEALAGLIINHLRGVLRAAAIKAPAFGDRRKALLEDLAIVTGGQFLAKDLGFEWKNVELGQLGRCEKVEITKERTVFFKGAGESEAIAQRKRQIEAQIAQSTSTYDKEKIEERLGKLEGNIAVIKVGGFSEVEIKERKARVEDAVNATRAAMEEGFTAGAGTAYLRAIPDVLSLSVAGDERFGAEVVARALRKPLAQLANNVGVDGPAVVAEVEERNGHVGFDAVKNEYVDLVSAGIVDPVKVLRSALLNAVSIASLNLTSDALIADIPEGKEAVAGAST
ncbi:MAG: chaperonin GroEL [Planctomycetes bacterium]|nr:chaperonin GroEL [Planctomycetota bacterium]